MQILYTKYQHGDIALLSVNFKEGGIMKEREEDTQDHIDFIVGDGGGAGSATPQPTKGKDTWLNKLWKWTKSLFRI